MFNETFSGACSEGGKTLKTLKTSFLELFTDPVLFAHIYDLRFFCHFKIFVNILTNVVHLKNT